ncbi:nibrin isoform X2 [Sphaerodactylus townsendi]|uniref:nibrin isoform X2 n=1 Tax=Sphaerodactylus townsendi TaxID=933632 RepID=UPI0020263991|nr:nibrin isoform X2 [Sphaerodactylus townsendi]
MWNLVAVSKPSPGEPHHLLIGIEYVVGRKNCAILIQDDSSISRSHAVLSVTHPPVNLSQSSTFPVLTLKDTSKYGTFVNGEKLPNGSSKTLQSGDRITFGVFESKYRVEYEALVVCSSCLELSQKSVLNQNILQLGGHVVNEWKEECTHLVMVSVKFTVKTICALICGRPITKPEYFAELIKAIRAKQQLPKPESFYPPLDEPTIKNEKVDLAACPERRTIFRGKKIVFLSAKQHAKLSPAVTFGGGEAKLMTEGAEDAAAALVTPHVCVIDVGSTGSQASASDLGRKWNDTVTTVLERKKYRTISEAEIGLAVIFASTERYCNPQASPNSGEKPAASSSDSMQPSISLRALVEETVMPTCTGDATEYVTDAELVDTCMEMFGSHQEIPVQEQKGKRHPLDRTTIKETPLETSTVNMGATAAKMNRQPGADRSHLSFSPSKVPGYGRNQEISSQKQSNSITNYFQTVTKKRERNEEGETSVSKYAKIDEKSSQASTHTPPVRSLLLGSKTEGPQQGQCTLDQKMNQSSVDMTRKSVMESSKSEGKNLNENIPSGKSTSKKRKELDDLAVEDLASLEVVFETQELNWEEGLGEGDGRSMKKKQKLEPEGNGLQEGSSVRQETVKLLNPDTFASDFSNLPSRLLLSELRSLVVSQPRRGVDSTARTNYGHLNNFKKFKKVPYPGAGQFPHIIGGSDLVAHNAKKNSEIEEWLKQEMEEQSRHAREESLADDLFRYNPHTKRR